jgi:hypothetical protein
LKNQQVFFCPDGYEEFREAPRYTRLSGGLPLREVWGSYGINYEGLAKRRAPYFASIPDNLPKPANTSC